MSWDRTPASPIGGRSLTTAACFDDGLFVWSGALPSRSGEGRYRLQPDGATLIGDQWRIVAEAPIAPRIRTAVTLVEKYVLVWGGAGDISAAQDPTDFVYYTDGALYSLDNGTWTLLPEAPLVGRSDAAMVAVGNLALVAGGEAAGIGPVHGAALFDVAALDWRPIAEPPHSSVIAAMSGDFASFSPDGVTVYQSPTDSWETVAAPPTESFVPNLATQYGADDAVVVQETRAWIWRSGARAFEDLGTIPVDNVTYVSASGERIVVWDESIPAAAVYEPGDSAWERLDPPNSFESRVGTAGLCLNGDTLTTWSGWHESEATQLARDTGYRLTLPQR